MKRICFVLSMVLVFSGYLTSANSSDLYVGESRADVLLRKDTFNIIDTFVKANGCSSINKVDTNVKYYQPSSATKGHQWGNELWKVMACSRTYTFDIRFEEDGIGGTNIYVSMAK